MAKVVIAGAGLTGLSAAWELSKRGHEVEIIEKESEVGGLARSFRRNGYSFDYGPHAIFTSNEKVYNKIKGLIGSDLKSIGKRNIKILFKGNYFDYPLQIKTVLMKLSIFTSTRCLIDYVYYNSRRKILKQKEVSFEDWLTNRFGKRLYHLFFRDYTYKVWGVDPRKLDKSFASERIPKLDIFKMIKGIIAPEKKQSARNLSGFSSEELYYPAKGVQQIADSIIKELIKKSKKNVKIMTNSEVKKIILKKNKVESIVYSHNGKERKTKCDLFISTMPIVQLVDKINPRPEKEVIDAANSLIYRKVNFLFIVVNKDKIFDSHWLYYHDKEIIFYRIYETSAFNKGLFPAGKTGLCMEISENASAMSKKKLFETAVRNLESVGALKRKDIESYYFGNVDFGYPIYTIGYKEKWKTISRWLDKTDNMVSAGRQGMFKYLDMDHCIMIGSEIAEQLEKGRIDNKIYNISANHGSNKA